MDEFVAAELVRGQGVLVRKEHPDLRHRIDVACRRGELQRLLPGVYAAAGEVTLAQRARAACLTDPGAVVIGVAAAHLIGWTHLPEPAMVAVATGVRAPQEGYVWLRRRVPPQLVRRLDGGIRVTTKALTALDLHDEVGGDELERALRAGVTVAELERALSLTPGRRRRTSTRRAVRSLRTQPWSVAEREAHVALRQAGISGWVANRAIYDRRGEELLGYGDLVFAELRLILEVDGRHHLQPEQVAKDGERTLRFAREGWEVIRLPASLVLGKPEQFVAIVRDVLRTRTYRRARPRRRRPGVADGNARVRPSGTRRSIVPPERE